MKPALYFIKIHLTQILLHVQIFQEFESVNPISVLIPEFK